MQCYTQSTFIQAYPTDIWHAIASEIITYIDSHQSPLHYSFVTQYIASFPQGYAHHKHCIILYATQPYDIAYSTQSHSIRKPYVQESDTIYYDVTSYECKTDIPADTYCLIPTKTTYSILPHTEDTTIYAFFLPQYHIMEGDATVEIQCFSMLHSFMPSNAHAYPVWSTWTLYDVIDSLGMEHDVVRIVFVDNIATSKETQVTPNTKITLFPGIGGG